MNKSIHNLMNEHQLILQVLASLETLAHRLQESAPVPREDIAQFATFFREFADKCHHCKEEDRLFVKMVEFGFSKEYGPLAVMLAEHDDGRSHVQHLWQIGGKSGPLTSEETLQVIGHASQFVPLLTDHIAKEDNILYPMAQKAIPAGEFAQLDTACEAFEHEVMQPGQVQQLRELAAQLILAYPAAPNSVATASACFACR